MEYLEIHYPENTLQKTNGIIDPYASIAAAGSREPINHMKHLIGLADAITD